MAKLLSKNHFEIVKGDLILSLNNQANKAKESGAKVINATVGMLFDDEGKLANFKIVDDVIVKCGEDKTKRYGSINGGDKFGSSVVSWLFDNVDISKIYTHVIGTIGATGALSLSMRNYCDPEQEVLVPSIRWSNYDAIVRQVGCKVKEYNLFNSDDTLDLDSINQAIDYSLKKYQRAYLLINDPCQNPTGYSMTKDEWKKLLDLINSKPKEYPIILLDDIAYLNYTYTDYDEIFELMVNSLRDNFMVQLSFSASKTLSIYGFRGGALVGMGSSSEIIDDFKGSCESCARSIWSMPSTVSCRVIEEAFKEKEVRNNIKKTLKDYRDVLQARAKIFFEEAELVNLVSYPYHSGFFVLVPCENGKEVCTKLADKNIFVVPMCGGIRISLSSLTNQEVKGLAKAIKYAMK